jgi:hypothetical protein
MTKAGYIPLTQKIATHVPALISIYHGTQTCFRIWTSHDTVYPAWFPFDTSVSPAYVTVNLVQVIKHLITNSFTDANSPEWTFGFPFRGFLMTHTYRHTVGILWTSDHPVAETSAYTGQHNIKTQQTNINAPSVIRTRDPSNQASTDLRLRPRDQWDRHLITNYYLFNRKCPTEGITAR